MVIIWIIVAIICLSSVIKWIIFICITPAILFFRHKHQCYDTSTRSEKKINNKFASIIKRYIIGFLRYMDFQVGLIPSHHFRNFIYRYIFGVKLSRNAIIYWGAEIRKHSNLKIGEGSIIGDKAILDARNGIEIGKNVNFSTGVHIWTEQHDHRDPMFRCISGAHFKVKICDRAWVGPGVTILHSVTIGEGAVIGAGAVVTNDVEPYSICVGIPAKIIGYRNRDLEYNFIGNYIPFF